MPFKKNDPNINREGRPPKGDSWAEIVREITERVEEKTGRKYKELVAQALVDKAMTGDISAIREIGDRLDGKAIQSMQQNIISNQSNPTMEIQYIQFEDMSGGRE